MALQRSRDVPAKVMHKLTALPSPGATFPEIDTRSLRFPHLRDLPERYRVRVFFRTWQVTSGDLFSWSRFWFFWASVLRRLATWQDPRPNPQGPGLYVARAGLALLGDAVEAGPTSLGFFCSPAAGE